LKLHWLLFGDSFFLPTSLGDQDYHFRLGQPLWSDGYPPLPIFLRTVHAMERAYTSVFGVTLNDPLPAVL